MSSRGHELDATNLRELFQALSDKLKASGSRAQLFVVGGAAMALAYDEDRLTRDVDAVFIPAPLVRKLAEEISEEFELEPDWINDAAKGFMPGPDENPTTVFQSESLVVQVPSPDYLLAMKLHAYRNENDLRDSTTLFMAAGFTTAAEAIELLERRYGAARLLPRHRYIAADVASRVAEERARDRPGTSRIPPPPAATNSSPENPSVGPGLPLR